MDSSRTTAPESPPRHFQLHFDSPNQDLFEAGLVAQSGRPFTATIRISNPGAGQGKVASDFPKPEAVDIQVKFTGEEYLVQDPVAGDWVTLTQVLAEEATEDGLDVLAKVAGNEPLELPEQTTVAEPDNTDVLIIAGTLIAGAGYGIFKAAQWGWKKLFGKKKKAAIKDPGIQIDDKIRNQMQKRGWDENSIQETIKNPHKTAQAIDRTSNNENATAYFNKDGHYVVRNDKTGKIIQVSDKNKIDWVPDPSFSE